MPFESVRIDLPIFALVAAASVAAPDAAPEDDEEDAELEELDGLDELEVLDEVFESLLQAAATSRTALMRRREARFMPVLTVAGRPGIAGMTRIAQAAGAGRRGVAATSPRPISAMPLHCRRGRPAPSQG